MAVTRGHANGTSTGHANGHANGTAKSRKRGSDTPTDDSLAKQPKLADKTDVTRWRLKDDDSRHTWEYLEDDAAVKDWPQSTVEKYLLNMPLVSSDRPPSHDCLIRQLADLPGPHRIYPSFPSPRAPSMPPRMA
jgi:hypothetical protein